MIQILPCVHKKVYRIGRIQQCEFGFDDWLVTLRLRSHDAMPAHFENGEKCDGSKI